MVRALVRRGFRVDGVVESVERYVVEELGNRARFTWIHRSELVERRPPRRMDDEVLPALAALRRHVHPPTFVARLPAARVVGDEPIVLTDDGRAILESAFDRFQLQRNPAYRARLPVGCRIRGRRLLLANQWAGAHFHWLLDTLPRLALLPPDDDAPILVPRFLGPAARESLRLAGVPEERLERIDHLHLRVDELVLPSLVGRTGNPPRWALDWLRDRLVPSVGRRRRRLYVSRADAPARRVANEDAVLSTLAPLGFERFLPGEWPLAEQLRAFAEAEVVVGAHGAGLTGLIAACDTTVIELFDETYVNGCYYTLAEALGLDYWYLTCSHSDGDLLVSIPVLRRILEAAKVA